MFLKTHSYPLIVLRKLNKLIC